MSDRFRKILAVTVIAFLTASLPGSAVFTRRAEANWVDDWVSATSGGGPMYFEGQKRGYYSGGGFSARWGSSVDPLLTITAPKMKGGCGGFAEFLGGVGFGGLSERVDNLLKILASGPAEGCGPGRGVVWSPRYNGTASVGRLRAPL
ncbi:hypothetical protein EG829_14435, partial [bacterium]|nr:hypothetical protein [bacterium]